MKRPSKVISHFKNSDTDKGLCRVCGDWWTDLSNKNHRKIVHKEKVEEKEIEMK